MAKRTPLTMHEAADRLGVHYMTVYRYVRTGRLPAVQAGGRWEIDPGAVDALRRPVRRPSGQSQPTRPAMLATRLLAGDEAGAWQLVEAALAAGMDAARFHVEVLAPALRLVGDDWAAGHITVADEHRATVVANRLIGRLGPLFARRGLKKGTVVVTAPAGERHGVPAAIVADLLRGAGYTVVDLGVDVPPDSLTSVVAREQPIVVLVGVTTPGLDGPARAALAAARAGSPTAVVLAGGAAVGDADHAVRLGADGWTGADGFAVLRAVEDVSAGTSPARH